MKYPRYYRKSLSSYKLTDKEKDSIKKLYIQGKSIRELAKMFDVTSVAISYWVNENRKKRVIEINRLRQSKQTINQKRKHWKNHIKNKRLREEKMKEYDSLNYKLLILLREEIKKNYPNIWKKLNKNAK